MDLVSKEHPHTPPVCLSININIHVTMVWLPVFVLFFLAGYIKDTVHHHVSLLLSIRTFCSSARAPIQYFPVGLVPVHAPVSIAWSAIAYGLVPLAANWQLQSMHISVSFTREGSRQARMAGWDF